MGELRWNPLIRDWVIFAAHRHQRPEQLRDNCPFCPGAIGIPHEYTVHYFENDFPALSQETPCQSSVSDEIYQAQKAYGRCEVILYSPEHHISIAQLSEKHLKKLVDLWAERFLQIKQDKRIKYILIFENKGESVGATITHPHGQIYAYPYIPKRLEIEIESCCKYFKNNQSCLICDILKKEMDQKTRIILQNEDFVAFIPHFSEYPYGVYIVAKKHKIDLSHFNDAERTNLGMIISDMVGTYDNLFGYAFPYMMCLHQAPVNCNDNYNYYHFHVEFYSPVRSRDKRKINAAGEIGAWAHVNPTLPEEKAEELRQAYLRFLKHRSR
jgi:UDPglucose--hexose-1-phosphate uridylyltransferase